MRGRKSVVSRFLAHNRRFLQLAVHKPIDYLKLKTDSLTLEKNLIDPASWTALRLLLRRSYWDRIWILQEVVLPKFQVGIKILLCGEKEIDADYLFGRLWFCGTNCYVYAPPLVLLQIVHKRLWWWILGSLVLFHWCIYMFTKSTQRVRLLLRRFWKFYPSHDTIWPRTLVTKYMGS